MLRIEVKFIGVPRSDHPDIAVHARSKQKMRLKNGCVAKTGENAHYEVTSPRIWDYIQYMKQHTIIGKFMGI
jgi:hypothetical protein